MILCFIMADTSSVVFKCSGKTGDGSPCDHAGNYPFDKCPKCGIDNKPRVTRKEVSCPGEKHPCGATLSIEEDYCGQCGWKINKELFITSNKCTRLRKDGSLCGAQVDTEDDFCHKCGNRVEKGTC